MEINVPLDALALVDGEESVMPEAGDSVSVTITGRVSSLTDGGAVISVETANGMDIGGESPEPEPEPEELSLEDERSQILEEIKKAGNVE